MRGAKRCFQKSQLVKEKQDLIENGTSSNKAFAIKNNQDMRNEQNFKNACVTPAILFDNEKKMAPRVEILSPQPEQIKKLDRSNDEHIKVGAQQKIMN